MGSEDAELADLQSYIDAGLGFQIHPTIVDSLSQKTDQVRVADISRGTQSSDAAAVTKLFPAAVCEKVELKDVVNSDGIEPAKRGQFDLVTARLLHATLDASNWETAFRNLISLLRPGGWLQFVDFDPLTARIAGLKPGSPDGVLRELLRRYSDVLSASKAGNTHRISATMRKNGLIEQDSDMYPMVPEVRFTKIVAREAVDHLRDSGAMDEDDAKKLSVGAEREIETARSLIWYDLWCHIAQKPQDL